MSILTLLILLAAAATLVSLVSGIVAMGEGEDGLVGHFNSAQWMVWRVVFQGLALLLMVIALFVH